MKILSVLSLLGVLLSGCVVVPARPAVEVAGPPVWVVPGGYYGHGYYHYRRW